MVFIFFGLFVCLLFIYREWEKENDVFDWNENVLFMMLELLATAMPFLLVILYIFFLFFFFAFLVKSQNLGGTRTSEMQ